MTFIPDSEKINHYLPGRRPYVECTINERKIHASILGWQGEMILIGYPPRMISKYQHGPREAEWIHKSQAVRIRRENSRWAELEDDWLWHEA